MAAITGNMDGATAITGLDAAVPPPERVFVTPVAQRAGSQPPGGM